jgi:4-amino-4-deoxy-L-arabinose transferase-like glycosyltransferase
VGATLAQRAGLSRSAVTGATAVVAGIAAAHVVVQLACSARYGYHRDELYFLATARHLAWGFVDQPPFTPAVARLAGVLFGESLVGLRLFSILASGAVVILGGLLAREFGGGRYAQGLAALCMAVSTFVLIAGHMLGTTAFDQLAWGLCAYLVVRLLRTGDERLWLLVGLVAGVGLLNKHLVLFFGLGLVVGLLATEARRQLRSPRLWAGGALALLIVAPNLLWQVQYGWPTIEMTRNLQARTSGLGTALALVPMQLVMVNPFLAPIWMVGLWWLLRGPDGRRYRALGWAYVAILLVLVAVGGKFYYLAPMYVVLLGAGAVAAERALRRPARRVLTVLAVAAGLLTSPIALPVLPPAALNSVPVHKLNPELAETLGWQELVDTVAQVYQSLPPEERATAVIFTANYGEAGAIDLLGPARGLPAAISGHNNYWLWGPGQARVGTTIAVGVRRERLEAVFGEVTLAGRIANAYGVDNGEQGAPVWLCRQQKLSWVEAWPSVKHYN